MNSVIQAHQLFQFETHRPKMMSSQPVVVTKMFPSLLASSMVVTS